jgi:hypothetical protein
MKKDPKVRQAAEKLEKQLGLMVGSAYGAPNGVDEEWETFLIVWTNNAKVKFPATFEGFKVVRRDIPVAL